MSKVMVARKNLQTHSFDFPKIPAAKKNGSYKSVTATVVNYGWWAIWTTSYNLLSMHKTHVINLVTVQTRVPSRHELVMG